MGGGGVCEMGGGVDGGGEVIAAQGHEETHEGLGLGGGEGIAVGGHVSAALQDLANDLVFRHARSDGVECGATLAADTGDGVAVAALLVLQDERSLAFERSAVAQDTGGMGRWSRHP